MEIRDEEMVCGSEGVGGVREEKLGDKKVKWAMGDQGVGDR